MVTFCNMSSPALRSQTDKLVQLFFLRVPGTKLLWTPRGPELCFMLRKLTGTQEITNHHTHLQGPHQEPPQQSPWIQTPLPPVCFPCCQMNLPKTHTWSCAMLGFLWPPQGSLDSSSWFLRLSSIKTHPVRGWREGWRGGEVIILRHEPIFFSWYIPFLFSPLKRGPYVHCLGRGIWLGKSRTSLQAFLTYVQKPKPTDGRWFSCV